LNHIGLTAIGKILGRHGLVTTVDRRAQWRVAEELLPLCEPCFATGDDASTAALRKFLKARGFKVTDTNFAEITPEQYKEMRDKFNDGDSETEHASGSQ
jgi:hypothetical protein